MRYAMNWTQPRGLAASVIEGVKHRFDQLRERTVERGDASENDNGRHNRTKEDAMRNAKSLALRRDDAFKAREHESEIEGIELTLRNSREGQHRLDLDLKLKGSRSENDRDDFEQDEETELGIEEASEHNEEADEEEEAPEEEPTDDEDEDAASHQDSLEEDEADADEEDDEAEASFEDDEPEARAEEREEEEEDLEARAKDEDDEDEDEDLEARAEDEDEDLEARAEDEDDDASAEDDEDEDVEARAEEDEEDDLEARDEDEESLHDEPAEKRAALRSAGDGGALRILPARQNDKPSGAAGSALREAAEQKPRPAKKNQADRVIAIAKKQVGVREGKNNYTKFAAELIKAKIADPWWQNQPWCQTFQAWAFVEAGYRKLAPMTPGCATAVSWFRARKRVNQYPAIGAQVFFGGGGGDHVGLVYKYDPTSIWTIEGNTNDKGSSEGIGVFLKKRPRKSAFGYGYPRYADGIVTADPRKKGKAGFTFKKTASTGARDTASEPERDEKSLPWVSVKQVQWAATHSASAERAAKAGAANPRGDVKLVQRALENVMGRSSKDPHGIFDEDTQRLFNQFRREKLKFAGISASAKPGAKGLAALGRRSKLFRVRTGSMVEVDEKSAPTTPAKISARDVTYKRCTTPSSPENIRTWIRQACKKAGATPSSAWVKGYKTIISRESGGNPNACNVWDSNAKTPPGFRKVKDFGDGYTRQGRIKLNGRPTHFQCSRGIVQCIPQTFAHNHARGTSRNIYDPVASIAASMRYVRSRYNVAKNGSNLARKVQQADPTRDPKGY
jgi:chemotaxis protein histidine kinase CheA